MIRLRTTDPTFEAQFVTLLAQARETTETVDRAVADIIAAVRAEGDEAVIEFTARFDRQTLTARENNPARHFPPDRAKLAFEVAHARLRACTRE